MWKVVWKVCKTFCRSRAKKEGYVNICGDGRKDGKKDKIILDKGETH